MHGLENKRKMVYGVGKWEFLDRHRWWLSLTDNPKVDRHNKVSLLNKKSPVFFSYLDIWDQLSAEWQKKPCKGSKWYLILVHNHVAHKNSRDFPFLGLIIENRCSLYMAYLSFKLNGVRKAHYTFFVN